MLFPTYRDMIVQMPCLKQEYTCKCGKEANEKKRIKRSISECAARAVGYKAVYIGLVEGVQSQARTRKKGKGEPRRLGGDGEGKGLKAA